MVAALLRPWRDARTWRELAHLCTDLLVGTVTFTIVIVLLATSLGLAIVAPLAVPVVWLLLASAQVLGRIERTRLAALLDAALVRIVLVPATMELLGDANWWLPRWLDRILPRFKVEGDIPAPEPELRDRVSI